MDRIANIYLIVETVCAIIDCWNGELSVYGFGKESLGCCAHVFFMVIYTL